MRVLSTPELLEIWERGVGETSVERALLLLRAACSDTAPEKLAELSIGRRDSLLLTLREETFGPRLVCLVTCPGCAERIELRLDTADLRISSESTPLQPLSVKVAGRELCFRLPASLDLVAIVNTYDIKVARQILLKRCLLNPPPGVEESFVNDLPQEVVASIAGHIADADPQADIHLDVRCPSCGNAWQAAFDIAAFLWSELDAWAQRVLHTVHRLASAYGWSESDILAMSTRRRQFYLGLVSG